MRSIVCAIAIGTIHRVFANQLVTSSIYALFRIYGKLSLKVHLKRKRDSQNYRISLIKRQGNLYLYYIWVFLNASI